MEDDALLRMFRLLMANPKAERQRFFAAVLTLRPGERLDAHMQEELSAGVVGGGPLLAWLQEGPGVEERLDKLRGLYLLHGAQDDESSLWSDLMSQWKGDSALWTQSAQGRRNISTRACLMCVMLALATCCSILVFLLPTLRSPRVFSETIRGCLRDTAEEWPRDFTLRAQAIGLETVVTGSGTSTGGLAFPASCRAIVEYVLPFLAEGGSSHPTDGSSTSSNFNNTEQESENKTSGHWEAHDDGDPEERDEERELPRFGFSWLALRHLAEDEEEDASPERMPRMPRYWIKFELEKTSAAARISSEALLTLYGDGRYTLWMGDEPGDFQFSYDSGGSLIWASRQDVVQWHQEAVDILDVVVDSRWKLAAGFAGGLCVLGSVLLILSQYVFMAFLYLCYLSGCCCTSPASWGYVRVLATASLCLLLLMNRYSAILLFTASLMRSDTGYSSLLIFAFGVYRYFLSGILPLLINFVFYVLFMNVCMYGDILIHHLTTGGN